MGIEITTREGGAGAVGALMERIPYNGNWNTVAAPSMLPAPTS